MPVHCKKLCLLALQMLQHMAQNGLLLSHDKSGLRTLITVVSLASENPQCALCSCACLLDHIL